MYKFSKCCVTKHGEMHMNIWTQSEQKVGNMNCILTLSTSQTLTVLSNEEVARRGVLGLKRTSVIS
jgi:hypothetical protein